MKLHDHFKEFLRLFNEHRVEYLLIGGYAVGIHGYPRATKDLDLWIRATPENARKVSSEDLKTNKRARGRHRDLDDLEHLP